ncbi:family 20 glycosylhydrolase [Kribbella sp. NPDC005582]|uniref:family 20 glycosylhydrolase n=1 Tax=Kribbella sp. NPDC005582 TaxID=3156893 RepID=UPI00339E0230
MIPSPVSTTPGEGVFVLTAGTPLTPDSALTAGTPLTVGSPELAPVAAQFATDLRLDSALALLLPAGASSADAVSSAASGGIHITFGADGLDDVPAVAGVRADGAEVDERYGLEVSSTGIRVWSPTTEGVFRGLTTLRQLIAVHGANIPCQRIIDGPRFAWRGLSFDVVRTFHPPETVRRVIDMCSLYKLNVLHLHLTDDQGWRFEVPNRPELIKFGSLGAMADRPGGYYSPLELAELNRYAEERFVTLVPEIDFPGHTGAVSRAYPELTTELPGIPLPDGGHLEFHSLDPADPAVWTFVEDVVDAVVPQFPRSAYLHIGGDEAWGMSDEAHATFVRRAAELVRDKGKRVVGWQEIARADVDPADVTQYWLDVQDIDAISERPEVPEFLIEHLGKARHDVPKALERGGKLLVSATTYLYFDRPHAAESADPEQEETRARVGLRAYPPATIHDGIDWDPVANTPGVTSDDQLAGVEAAVWCETVTSRDDLEFLLLPRLPGAAEKAWSHTTTWPTYATHLAAQSPLWTHRGWTYFKSSEIDWL